MLTLENIEGQSIFRNLFENSAVGMSVTSLDGRLHANQALCQMLGYTKEELTGKPWRDLTYPEDIEPNIRAIDLILSEKCKSMRWEKSPCAIARINSLSSTISL